MQPPKLDLRNKEDLLKELSEFITFYTPEWRFNREDPDPGSALFYIFTEMYMENIKKFNQVPLRHYIAFLNLLNISMHPQQPASAFVQYQLSNGASDPVLVREGTKLAAETEEEEIIFESEQNILISPSTMEGMFKVNTNKDFIQEVQTGIINPLQQEDITFSGIYNYDLKDNRQEHCLFLGNMDQFNLKSTVKITIELFHSTKRYKERAIAEQLAHIDHVEWFYFNEKEWAPFDRMEAEDNKVILYKERKGMISESEVAEINCRWIKCRVKEIKKGDTSEEYTLTEVENILVKTEHYDIDESGGFYPDLLFFNDLQLEENKGFHPFGEYFQIYTIFYISSQEALSKKGSVISLHFDLKSIPFELKTKIDEQVNWKLIMKESEFPKPQVQDVSVLKVVWEYWNGNAWVRLPMDAEYDEIFSNIPAEESKRTIQFECPHDLEETYVNSHLNNWIRVRILHIDNIFSPDVLYHSPYINNMKITYESAASPPQVDQCLSYNNLEYKNLITTVQSEGFTFHPFSMLNSSYPAVYFCFHMPPEKGPISIYFHFLENVFSEEERPLIEWEYFGGKYDGAKWKDLKVIDHTGSFTKSGTIQFNGPRDFVKYDQLGKDCYWIRAVNKKVQYREDVTHSPKLESVFMNTAKVIQREKIENETPDKILKGLADKYFQLANAPMFTETVWIDETGEITTNEIKVLQLKNSDEVHISKDADGNIQQCLVKWKEVKHFHFSNSDDRHYIIDRINGQLFFGDGVFGKELPNDNPENIKVDYFIGGGKKGNLERDRINKMLDTIPFIHAVTNPYPSGGGTDMETIEQAIDRGPQLLKHRNRAVTTEDFESLVKEISPNIVKVKCLANYNLKMEKELGCVTVVVYPDSDEEGFQFFAETKERIERELLETAACTVTFPQKICVTKPALLEVSVAASLVVENMETVVETELESIQKLKEFLHPVSGNYDGEGWEIGQGIHVSIFYALLKSVRNVKYVENLYFTVRKHENGTVEDIDNSQVDYPHCLIINGNHKIDVKAL